MPFDIYHITHRHKKCDYGSLGLHYAWFKPEEGKSFLINRLDLAERIRVT